MSKKMSKYSYQDYTSRYDNNLKKYLLEQIIIIIIIYIIIIIINFLLIRFIGYQFVLIKAFHEIWQTEKSISDESPRFDSKILKRLAHRYIIKWDHCHLDILNHTK